MKNVSLPKQTGLDWPRPKVQVKDWGTLTILVETDDYMLSKIEMKAGTTGPLQYHHRKDETDHVVSGEGFVHYDQGDGHLMSFYLWEGMTFRIPPGAVHRVSAKTDLVIYEASTPHVGDRCNVADLYGDEAGKPQEPDGP